MSKQYSYITELKPHNLTVHKMLDLASLYLHAIQINRQIQMIIAPEPIKVADHYSNISEANSDLFGAMAHIPDVLKFDHDRIITITLSNHTFMLSHAINAVWLLSGVIRECDLWIQDITDWGMSAGNAQVSHDAVKEALVLFRDGINDVKAEIGRFIDQEESFWGLVEALYLAFDRVSASSGNVAST